MQKQIDVILKWTAAAKDVAQHLGKENAKLMKEMMSVNTELTSFLLDTELKGKEKQEYVAELKTRMDKLQERVHEYGLKLQVLKSQKKTAQMALDLVIEQSNLSLT